MADPNAITPAVGNPTPAVSPTGEARIPAKYVPFIMAAWAGIAAGVQALPDGQPKAIANLALLVLGPLVAMVVPGLRKPT
jgi:hypothetical protein